DASGWTAWQPRVGNTRSSTLLVVNAVSVRTVGVFLGALVFGVAVWLGRILPRPWSYRLWVLALTGLTLAFLWRPGFFGPGVVGSLAALGACTAWWLMRGLFSRPLIGTPKGLATAKSVAAGLGVCLAVLASPCLPVLWSQNQEPFPVLLVENPEGKHLALLSPA